MSAYKMASISPYLLLTIYAYDRFAYNVPGYGKLRAKLLCSLRSPGGIGTFRNFFTHPTRYRLGGHFTILSFIDFWGFTKIEELIGEKMDKINTPKKDASKAGREECSGPTS